MRRTDPAHVRRNLGDVEVARARRRDIHRELAIHVVDHRLADSMTQVQNPSLRHDDAKVRMRLEPIPTDWREMSRSNPIARGNVTGAATAGTRRDCFALTSEPSYSARALAGSSRSLRWMCASITEMSRLN